MRDHPGITPEPVLRRLIAQLRDDPEALRLLGLLLTHIAPPLALHVPVTP